MQIKNRQKLLVIVALTGVTLFAAVNLVYDPLAKAYSGRAARIGALRKQLADGKMLIQRAPGLMARWDGLLRNTLTNNPSAAEQQVFRAIDAWAQNSGATISAITPQWKHDTEDYSTFECRVEAAGDLRRLSRFLYSVETEPLALRLESVELAARDKAGQQLTLGLQFSGLVLPPTNQWSAVKAQTRR